MWYEFIIFDKDVVGVGVFVILFLWFFRRVFRIGILLLSYSIYIFYVGKILVSLWFWMKFMFWNRIKYICNVVWIDYIEYK